MRKVKVTVNGACCQYDGKKIMASPALSVKAKVGSVPAEITEREKSNKIR